MNKIQQFIQKYIVLLWYLALLLAAMFTAFALSACRTVKYVPVETTRDIYHNTTDTLRDSIYHDIFVDRFIKGDTVFINKTEYLYRDKWRNHTDTLIRTDSVQVPYPVEKQLTAWQQFKQDNYITTVLAFIILTIMASGIYIIKRK